MKHILIIPLSFFMLLLFSGCPYESTYPPGNKDEANTQLAGKWKCLDPDYDIQKLDIKVKNNTLFVIKNEGLELTDQYNAWTTTIKGNEFLYVETVNSITMPTYALYKIKVEPPSATSWEVNSDAFNAVYYDNTSELRKELSRIMNNETTFGKPVKWAMIK